MFNINLEGLLPAQTAFDQPQLARHGLVHTEDVVGQPIHQIVQFAPHRAVVTPRVGHSQGLHFINEALVLLAMEVRMTGVDARGDEHALFVTKMGLTIVEQLGTRLVDLALRDLFARSVKDAQPIDERHQALMLGIDLGQLSHEGLRPLEHVSHALTPSCGFVNPEMAQF